MPKPFQLSDASMRVLRGRAKAAQRAAQFLALCQHHKIVPPVQEWRFWEGRRFAFDFAWPESKVALESEGGAWSGGAHTRGEHFKSDCRKYSEAAILGWCVIRVLSSELVSDETIQLVQRALARRSV